MTAKANKTKNTSNHNRLLDTLIIIAIACCVIFINIFTTNKFSDLEKSAHDSVFIIDKLPISEDDEFAEEIREFLPDTYKMIELYDENMNLMFQIQFDEGNHYQPSDIREYQEIITRIKNTQEGQARIELDGSEQDFFYKWVVNNKGETRLLIVYSNVEEVENLWVFSFVCYIVIILVFLLLIRLHIRHYKDQSAHYKTISDDVLSRIKR